MGLLSWLRRAPEPDYETLLSQLEASIKAREQHLLSIRLRERRANALFVTYGVAVWFVYVALWYFGVVGGADGVERVVGGLPVIGGPVVIIFTRRILRWWYKTQQDAEGKTLVELKKQQRDQVEELKRKTGYYSTRSLLEKYDEVIKKNSEVRGRPPPPKLPSSAAVAPGTPLQQRPPPNPTTGVSSSQQRQQPPQQQLVLRPLPPTGPIPRTFVDKLADALLGVSADEANPNNKYALICPKCYSHNGLAIREEWDTIQYQCPRCGHFNPRRVSISRQASSLRLRPASMLDTESPRSAGARRRSQSMHLHSRSSTGGDDDDDGEEDDGAVMMGERARGSEKQDEPEEVLMHEKAAEVKLRQRPKPALGVDDMDTTA